jgi:hypothetical protein
MTSRTRKLTIGVAAVAMMASAFVVGVDSDGVVSPKQVVVSQDGRGKFALF